MNVVIGGNRLGSGKKMHTNIDNYGRSTHNLSERFRSSITSGVLYPCFKKLCTRGDTFSIDMAGDLRTIPTKGPLFGKFKMQVDFFECGIRLYQGLLHNNPLDMILKMDQVKMPIMTIEGKPINFTDNESYNKRGVKFSNTCLMKYLGMSGLGQTATGVTNLARNINAVPMLAYYDIFKNYYANKQEKNAYVITGGTGTQQRLSVLNGEIYIESDETDAHNTTDSYIFDAAYNKTWGIFEGGGNQLNEYQNEQMFIQRFFQLGGINIGSYKDELKNISFNLGNQNLAHKYPIILLINGQHLIRTTIEDINNTNIDGNVRISVDGGVGIIMRENDNKYYQWRFENSNSYITGIMIPTDYIVGENDELKLSSFPLKNIDDMRYDLLSTHTLGYPYIVDKRSGLPYSTNCNVDLANETLNKYPMNGLVVKTYQNDIFNNWLNTEWIEGAGGLDELTKVQVDENGTFSMDALNFAKKMYNILNRLIAGSDGTYEGYLDVAYEETFKRHIETPIWLGGFSKDVVFDEVVQNSPTEDSPLGTLGGRGRIEQRSGSGGHVKVTIYEPSYIIGIVSLTPYISQSQGNDFDLTEVESIADIHKPGLDGIGYQDLLGERMAWFDAHYDNSTATWSRSKIGKLPSWIEYMTSWDKTYGDFAEPGEFGGYMVLTRDYELNETTGRIKDVTTYIDPKKYNYVFADTDLSAQNFWIELDFKVTARRLMSARIIPHV